MKKLLYAFFAVLFALGALSITGCSGDLHDYEAPRFATIAGYEFYVTGGGVKGNNDIFYKLNFDGTLVTGDVPYAADGNNWATSEDNTKLSIIYNSPTIKEGYTDWPTDDVVNNQRWGAGVDNPGKDTSFAVGGSLTLKGGKGDGVGNNFGVTGLHYGTFHLEFDPMTLVVKITQKEIVVVDADISGINDTTCAQVNAWVSIEDDCCGNLLKGKYFFNKKGDHYVATIPFNLTGATIADWSDNKVSGTPTYYMCWGKFGVGDNKSVKSAEKQWGSGDKTQNVTSLGFANTDNALFTDLVVGTKGVITITTTDSGNTVAVTTYP